MWAPLLIALTVIGTSACSVERFAARRTLSLLARTKPAVTMESDVELAAAATPSGLKLEGIPHRRRTGPAPHTAAHRGVLRLRRRLRAGRLGGRGQRGDRARADVLRVHGRNMLARCRAYALRALGPRWKDVLTVDDAAAEALLARAGAGDAAMLFWLATAVVSSIGMDPSDVPLAMLMPRLTAILERVVVVAPDLENGQPLMALGAIRMRRAPPSAVTPSIASFSRRPAPSAARCCCPRSCSPASTP